MIKPQTVCMIIPPLVPDSEMAQMYGHFIIVVGVSPMSDRCSLVHPPIPIKREGKDWLASHIPTTWLMPLLAPHESEVDEMVRLLGKAPVLSAEFVKLAASLNRSHARRYQRGTK